jgi:hypothetical protein
MELGLKFENQPPLISHPEVQEFIELRGVRPDDFYLIEELASFPKNLLIKELHNHFNLYRDRSERELLKMLQNAGDDQRKKLFSTFEQFVQKYDWIVAGHLERVLERI